MCSSDLRNDLGGMVDVVLNSVRVGGSDVSNTRTFTLDTANTNDQQKVYNGSFTFDSNPDPLLNTPAVANFKLTLTSDSNGAYRYTLELLSTVQTVVITGDEFTGSVRAAGPTPTYVLSYTDTQTGTVETANATVAQGGPITIVNDRIGNTTPTETYTNVALVGSQVNASTDGIGIENNVISSYIDSKTGALSTERLIYDPGKPASAITLAFKGTGDVGFGQGGSEDVLELIVHGFQGGVPAQYTVVLDSRDSGPLLNYTVNKLPGWDSIDTVEVTAGFYETSRGTNSVDIKIAFGFATETITTVALPVELGFAGRIFDADGDVTAFDPFTVTTVAGNSFAGSAEADHISGTAMADTLLGGLGDDILVGGAGNDILTGGDGADTFKWNAADKGTSLSPAVDVISDFNPSTDAASKDVLDLRDLLTGENHAAGIGNLSNYLTFSQSGADVTLSIKSAGGAGSADQVITLQNVTMQQLAGVTTGTPNSADVISNLLTNNKLITD